MTITICTIDPGCTAELKAYTEFRFFSALSRYANRLRAVDVQLRRINGPQASHLWKCTVRISDDLGERHTIGSVGRFLAESVDRAATRASVVLEHLKRTISV